MRRTFNMKLVVGVSGASGAPYAKRLLDFLAERAKKDKALEVALTASENGLRIYRDETGTELKDSGFPFYDSKDFDAPFASGSAGWDAMAVVPTSGGTLGRLASGASSDLLSRAAEVMLKERKRLLLCFRALNGLAEISLSRAELDAPGAALVAGESLLQGFFHRPLQLRIDGGAHRV